jgi:hypothetical protein
MNARALLLLLIAPSISPNGCATAPSASAPPVAHVATQAATPDARRAEIRRQIAKVCPVPLTADELERAAAIVEARGGDGEVAWLGGRLYTVDGQARVCRGLAL